MFVYLGTRMRLHLALDSVSIKVVSMVPVDIPHARRTLESQKTAEERRKIGILDVPLALLINVCLPWNQDEIALGT